MTSSLGVGEDWTPEQYNKIISNAKSMIGNYRADRRYTYYEEFQDLSNYYSMCNHLRKVLTIDEFREQMEFNVVDVVFLFEDKENYNGPK